MRVFLESIETVDKESWDRRLLQVPEATIWQTAGWAAYNASFMKKKPLFLLVREETGEIIAQLLLLQQTVHHRFFVDRPGQAVFDWLMRVPPKELHWMDGPIVFRKEKAAEALSAIIRFLEEYSRENEILLHRNIRLPLYWDSVEFAQKAEAILHQFGYERRERGTFVIDLRLPLDEIWASFKGNVRTAIRKCEKQQISIHTDLKGERLPEYQTILEEDRKRSSTRVLSVKQKFMHRDYIQGPNSEWRLYYALYEDRMVAGMIVFSFNGNAVHTGLCRSDFCRQKKLEAYYGIMWEIIKDGKKQGWARYDLAGVNPNPASRHERGIYSFKEKWGGKFIGYAEYSKVFRPRLERVISFVTRALKSEQ